MLNAVNDIMDLKSPPSNNLHPLKGDRKGQFAISVNGPWRLCFIIKDSDIYEDTVNNEWESGREEVRLQKIEFLKQYLDEIDNNPERRREIELKIQCLLINNNKQIADTRMVARPREDLKEF